MIVMVESFYVNRFSRLTDTDTALVQIRTSTNGFRIVQYETVHKDPYIVNVMVFPACLFKNS